MIIYKCALTGDELFTDTCKVEKIDGMYRVRAKFVTRSETIDESALGANPSSEEAQESSDANVVSGIDVVINHRLCPTGFGTKKEYQAYFKDFVKVCEKNQKKANPDLDTEAWRKQISETFKKVASNFKDYEFFMGESGNPDGNIALVKWEKPEDGDDEVPFVYFYQDGIVEEKV